MLKGSESQRVTTVSIGLGTSGNGRTGQVWASRSAWRCGRARLWEGEHVTEDPGDRRDDLLVRHLIPPVSQRGPHVGEKHPVLAEGVEIEPLEPRIGAIELRRVWRPEALGEPQHHLPR